MSSQSSNVVQIRESQPAAPRSRRPRFAPPAHYRSMQRAAWRDLVRMTDESLHVLAHRITFEIASTLLARFRSGRAMSATELREMGLHFAVLGLRHRPPTPRRSARARMYFR